MGRQRMRLRRWQRDALEQFLRARKRNFAVTACPGAGKTTWAMTACLHALKETPHRRIVVVAPTTHLKTQWADSAARFGLALEPNWDPRGGVPADAHGIVTTYAQVASSTREVAQVAHDAVVIVDEVHHAGSELAWGDALAEALATSAKRLLLSGTPFRSDSNRIPYVEYDAEDESTADFTYGYGQAVDDGGVVRPVFFPRIGGDMEWTSPDGVEVAASFTDELTRDLQAQRLRTALAADGGWLSDALAAGVERLREVRARVPDAGMIVFCMDQAHARAVNRMLRERGVSSTVAVSDDADASDRVDKFAADPTIEALVTVRLVSEGVDVPRLAVAVWATNVVSPLFFEQAVGRVVRWRADDGPKQAAWVFLPDDIRLRALAWGMREQRVHSLKKREDDDVGDELDDIPKGRDAEQVSLFAAISSSAGEVADHGPDLLGSGSPWEVPYGGARNDDDPTLEVELPVPPRTAAGMVAEGAVHRSREQLRRDNHDRVRLIAQTTGMSHEQVNQHLNDQAGIRSVRAATVSELRRRLDRADRWLHKV